MARISLKVISLFAFSCATLVGQCGVDATYAVTDYVARLNGNEVWAYASTIPYENPSIQITGVDEYLYLDSTFWYQYSAVSQYYGGTITANIYQYLYYNSGYFLGTYQLVSDEHWSTEPYCISLGYNYTDIPYYSSSNSYTTTKPTIQVSGDPSATSWAMWYLGGAPSINGYYTQLALVGNSQWANTDPLEWSAVAGSSKVSISPSGGTDVTVTSQAPSADTPGKYVYDVNIQVSTDGLPSAPFPVTIDAPTNITGYLSSQGYYSGTSGYQSVFNNLLYDTADLPMDVPITLHETIENCLTNMTTNWCSLATLTDNTWAPANWDGSSWNDDYYVFGASLTPVPLYKNPVGSTTVINKTQKFFVGTAGQPNTNVFTGNCVERNTIQFYTDHATRTSVTSPVAAASCASGQFSN